MSTKAYNCPCCGAPLTYDGINQKLVCASCANSYDADALEAMLPETDDGGVKFEAPKDTFDAADAAQMNGYICEACGAELMTENTTTATECPYCGSPTVLPERIEDGIKPELVVPFTVTKENAQQQFNDYFKGKVLLPNVFKNSRNRISEMRKLYVPYWLFDCDARGHIVYDAKKHRVERRGEWEIQYTDHYIVRREGRMAFEGIPVDGSVKMNNDITESLEPYDMRAAVPFQPAVLAGAMADHADVDAEACVGRAKERVEYSVASALRNTVNGYDIVTERSRTIRSEEGKITPVLMPVWLITTQKEQKTYTFAINGQTGKLTCDVPVDGKKAFLLCGGVFAGVLAIAMLVLYLMQQLASGTAVMAAVAAAIIALIVFAVLKGQLKQAVGQSSAGSYEKPGSFGLTARQDHFLHTTTTRRKIETNKKPD